MTMPLAAIPVDIEEAKRKLDAYRALSKEERTSEDRRIALAYAAVQRGEQIIDLPATVRAGGTQDTMQRSRWSSNARSVRLPRLAVCDAEAKRCGVLRRSDDVVFVDAGHVERSTQNNPGSYRQAVGDHHVIVPWDKTEAEWDTDYGWVASAMVPIVPAEHRPSRGLAGYHVLWEAEWTLEPPVDPALIKHVAGNLWVVHATWDLTELERAAAWSAATSGTRT